MKKHLIFTLFLGYSLASLWAQEKLDLNDLKQRTSYSIGANIGSNLKQQNLDLDAKALAAGIADAMNGKAQLNETEIAQVLNRLQQDMASKMEAQQKEQGDKNLQAGETFLTSNSKKEGVKSTASGLQYQVIKSGAGKSPKATDTVKVHYHGTLLDGTVFDSSVERKEPVTFGLSEVIPGWTEALQLMKEGDKWKLFIPSKLAYGARAAGKIGPNSTLIFEVELLAIEKPN
jgi:FKBP-type peptidyl-prolyl cis-trans isomerase FklB